MIREIDFDDGNEGLILFIDELFMGLFILIVSECYNR